MPSKFDVFRGKLPKGIGAEAESKQEQTQKCVEVIKTPCEASTREEIEARLTELDTKVTELLSLLMTRTGGKTTPTILAQAFRDTDKTKDLLNSFVERLKPVTYAYTQLFGQACEAEGIESVRLAGDLPVFCHPEVYGHVTDRDALREWYKAQGLERELNPNPNALNGLLRKMLFAGESAPPGVQAFIKDKVSVGNR